VLSSAAALLAAFLSILLTDAWTLRTDLVHQYTKIIVLYGESRLMVLIYESDPLDTDDARGRFYHVCRGRIDRTEIQLPVDEKVYECAVCGIDLEAEDFWLARQKGSV
jgi:hypothetical protein